MRGNDFWRNGLIALLFVIVVGGCSVALSGARIAFRSAAASPQPDVTMPCGGTTLSGPPAEVAAAAKALGCVGAAPNATAVPTLIPTASPTPIATPGTLPVSGAVTDDAEVDDLGICKVLRNSNLRTSPQKADNVKATISAGSEIKIAAESEDSGWYQLENNLWIAAGQCELINSGLGRNSDVITNTVGMTASISVPNCTFPTPSDENAMPKTTIEKAPQGAWFHRVFNEKLFVAPNWNGADSWFVTLALGPHSGGTWRNFGNPGQIIFRADSTTYTWCLGVLTNSKWKSQFMAGTDNSLPVAVNVKFMPYAPVVVTYPGGITKTGSASDGGDITIELPDDGVTVVAVAATSAAPTDEAHVWWGPRDRVENINLIQRP